MPRQHRATTDAGTAETSRRSKILDCRSRRCGIFRRVSAADYARRIAAFDKVAIAAIKKLVDWPEDCRVRALHGS